GQSARFVFVNIVERQPGIEPGPPAEIDAFAQSSAGLHTAADEREMRTAAQLQSLVLFPGVAVFVGFEERALCGRRGKLFPHKIAHAIDNLGALALMEKRVIRSGKNMHALYRRRETVE